MFCENNCPLKEGRKFPAVPGEGPIGAKLFVCGEAPGKTEEQSGRPFSGKAGRQVEKALEACGLCRDDVYLDNVVHCRPPDKEGNNRPPKAKEVNPCKQYLFDNIERVKPKLILALGKIPAAVFTGRSALKYLRGEFHRWNGIPVLITYHPAYGLRNAIGMKFFRRDVQKAVEFINRKEEKFDYHMVENGQVDRIIDYLSKAKKLSVDLETTGSNWRKDQIVSVSFCARPGEAFFFDVRKVPLEKLKILLESPVPKLGQNIKFDTLFLRKNGIDLKPVIYDTMLAAHLLDETRPSVDLNSLSADFTTMGGYEVELEEYTKAHPEVGHNYGLVPPEVLSKYSMGDVDATMRVHKYQMKELGEQKKLKLYSYLMVPTLNTLVDVEQRGMMLDLDYLNTLDKQYQAIIEETRKKITRYPRVRKFEEENDTIFNPLSNDQLAKIIFKDKEPQKVSKKTGKAVVDKKTLDRQFKNDKLAQSVLQLRGFSKFRETYVVGLRESAEDGVIYPNFSQAVAKTYRLSSYAPNLQNIPKKGVFKAVKKAFIARPGYALVSADYSQVELRVLATVSGDPALIDAFREGGDPIAELGAVLFRMNKDQITEDLRTKTKAFCYGTIYGSSAWGMAMNLDMRESDIEKLQDNFFRRFPMVQKYIDDTKSVVLRTGKVTSPLGATRHLPNGSEAELRQAINFPIQNMAGWVLFAAMIKINQWRKKEKLDMYIINSIHDQVLIESNLKLLPDITKQVEAKCAAIRGDMEMLFGYKFRTALPVKVTTGINWESL